MKRFVLIFISSAFFNMLSWSQACLPDGIYFDQQFQIDNFQVDYPGCTEIEGNVTINGYDISNLDGLNSLTSIEGSLYIGTSDFGGNSSLTSLEGLSNLTSIGGTLEIKYNGVLNSLSGLESLTSIGGDLNITDNYSLSTFSGIDNLTSISGSLQIWYNESLSSLTGLNNLNAASITDLTIGHNSSLSSCELQSICNYLSSPNGIVRIFSNSTGCNNPPEIAENCSIQLSCLPYGDYIFESQTDIDGFQADYNNCTQLSGEVSVNGTDISDLNGLSDVVSIGGNFSFYDNPALTNLIGLDNLASIGEDLSVSLNDNLISLTGLDNLTFIGSVLNIQFNNSLISLNGLEGLTGLNAHCLINSNDNLVNFTGLNNIAFIDGTLQISHNQRLNNMEGLENLTTVGQNLDIGINDSLVSLAGLNNLTTVGNELWIVQNNQLNDLEGLESLHSIGSDFRIRDNSSLRNLTGLKALASIEGDLDIAGNSQLKNIIELNNLTSVGGGLLIYYNDSLQSLAGLDYIDAESITNLIINNNYSLSFCEVQSICDYLADPNGPIDIHNNSKGCDSIQEVEDACEGIFIPELENESQFLLYPNPTTQELYIRNNSNSEVSQFNVYNHLGQNLIIQDGLDKPIDVSILEPGIYIIELITNEFTHRFKFIKN